MCVLAGVAGADVRTYDVKATRVATLTQMPSCDAKGRMLKDRHVVKIDDETGRVTVNGFKWQVFNPDPDLIMDFHRVSSGLRQKTYLVMDLYVNQSGLSGIYMLFGELIGGKPCADAVYLDGNRR